MMAVISAVCSAALYMKAMSIILRVCAMTCWEKEYDDVLQNEMKNQN